MVERGPEKAGVASPILALGTTPIAWSVSVAYHSTLLLFFRRGRANIVPFKPGISNRVGV